MAGRDERLKKFSDLVGRIYLFFDVFRMPEKKQIDLWFEKAGYVPDMAYDFIYDHITDSESKPRNLGWAIKKAWGIYQSQNQERIYKPHRTDCHECGGSGVIPYRRHDEIVGYNARFIVICAMCENWKSVFADPNILPHMTKESIEKEGWLLE